MQGIPVYTLVACMLALVGLTFSDLGTPCSGNTECTSDNSYCRWEYEGCEHGRCACHDQYFQQSYTHCGTPLYIGDDCGRFAIGQVYCAAGTVGSNCEDKECTCPENKPHVTAVDGVNYCYGHKYGEDCVDEEECLSHVLSGSLGVCEGTCQCANNAMRDGEACRYATYGEDCADDGVECNAARRLTCSSDNVCDCQDGEKWQVDKCVNGDATNVEEGARCDQDETVEGAAICSDDLVCDLCPEDAGGVETVCLRPANHNRSSGRLAAVGLLVCLSSVIFLGTVL